MSSIYRFRISGRDFEFDADPTRLMGDESLIIEDETHDSASGWYRRMASGEPTHRDRLLLAYIAMRRTNRSLQWAMFVQGVSALDIQPIDDAAPEPAADAAKPATRKPRTARTP